VNTVAAGLRDVYMAADSLAQLTFILTGREYPVGLLNLDEDKSERAARAMIQVNDSLPRLAERVNKVSAPVTLASVLGLDLIGKAAMLYGAFKSGKSNQGDS